MKKLLVFALAVVMLFSCMSASALNLDELPEDFKPELDSPELPVPEWENTESFANAKDIVTRNGDIYTVDNGSFKYVLDLENYPAILCITQDKMISFKGYLMLKDPNGFQQFMIEKGVSFNLYDLDTSMDVYIYTKEGDTLTWLIGDFSKLTAKDQQDVADILANNITLHKAGDITWMKVSDNKVITIYNNQYIFVEIHGNSPADDMADTLDVLSHLKLS